MNWRENLPALKFLGIFLGVYLAGNLLYGFYIELNYPLADHATIWVSHQSSVLMNLLFGTQTTSVMSPVSPVSLILENGKVILRIYEGCNGLNVMIVFVAFILAFSGPSKRGGIFILIGLVAIHLANLFRITLLFWVAKHYESYFYYVHKYVFTAALYVIVLGLWWIWVYRIMKAKATQYEG
ncbi:MAG: exosortase family protein XrtF [Cyclobacteriaceae bacterium]